LHVGGIPITISDNFGLDVLFLWCPAKTHAVFVFMDLFIYLF